MSAGKGLLDGLLGYHLRRAQARVFEDFMKALETERITPGQFGVMSLIHENRGINQSALARALGIERSTMVAVIDGLEGRGLVARRPSETDKRAHALELTQDGRRLYTTAKRKVRNHEKRIAAGLSEKEAGMLRELLTRVADST